jgi:hypothetical protein
LKIIDLDPSPVILTLLLHCLLPPGKGEFDYTLLLGTVKEKWRDLPPFGCYRRTETEKIICLFQTFLFAEVLADFRGRIEL